MKVIVSQHPAGVIHTRVTEAITDAQIDLMIRGIIKFLAHGKCRIVVELAAGVPDKIGEAIETKLGPQVILARRLGGDIRVLRSGTGLGLEGTIQAMVGGTAERLSVVQGALARLQDENLRLKSDLSQLLTRHEELVNQAMAPSSDQQLRAALKHFEALAIAAEEHPPKTS